MFVMEHDNTKHLIIDREWNFTDTTKFTLRYGVCQIGAVEEKNIMEGVIVRRVIPSDNSCLFNAVGFVMELDKHST
ncbi:hypothetical protein Sjap_025246 [Stephania japonica]|uniref:Ubiquitin thioesterase OTU1 n=1 Tax=Stephania japonica TaxID=461633 RepID=A0AAP0E195_9MAGN